MSLLAFPAFSGLMSGRAPVRQQADIGDEYFLNRPNPDQSLDRQVAALQSRGLDVQNPIVTPQQPQRDRVSGWRVLDRVLGGQTVSGGLDAERARLTQEAMRPQMMAQQQENENIARALGPQALLAYRSNPEAFGESVGYQYRPTTTGAGGVSTVFGTGQQVEAPRVLEFGNDLVQAGPISGTRTLATRGPSYAEQAQIARLDQDANQNQQRLELDYAKLGQDENQFQQRLGFDQSRQEAKPLTAQQSRQLEGYLGEIETAQSINSELSRFDGLLANGGLNLGPVANAQSGVLNRFGISTPNSTNYAEFRSTLERLRNDSLRLNNGVQTEGDAQRAWNELISNINDEGVVRRQIQRIQNLNQRAIEFKQGRVSALESGQYIGGRGGQQNNAPAPPPGFVLD